MRESQLAILGSQFLALGSLHFNRTNPDYIRQAPAHDNLGSS
jgi:hypothetical protein